METQQDNTDLFDSRYIIDFLKKWRTRLFIVGLAAAIISGAISYMIEPRFLSTVILIPTSTVSVSKSLIKEWGDVLTFGQEKEAEQMIQILHSDAIRNRIAQKYNLLQRYKIMENDPYKKLYLKLEFLDRVWVSRDADNSVEINVLDRQPDTAAFIANDMAALVDSVRDKIQKTRATQALNIVEAEYLRKKAIVEKLQDSLRTYTEQGVFDFETQSGIIYKQYVKSISKNNNAAVQQLEGKMKVIAAKGWSYVALRDFAYHERNDMFALGMKYEQAKLDVDRSLPTKYIIDPAIPSEKRLSPTRWAIVLISTISAVFLSVVLILILDKLRKVDPQP
jgi:capsular polysaccharide biosynthesis protein